MSGKKKKEFSKILAVIVTAVFVAFAIIGIATFVLFDRVVPVELLTFVATPFGVVISGYFVKAGAENVSKIKLQSNVDSTNGEKKYD